MILTYHLEASNELREAFEWYESQKDGLGFRFVNDVELAIKRIQNFSYSNAIIAKEYRRAILPIFPYGIFYKVKADVIEIYAIAHLHRKPYYWAKRKMS